MEGESKLDMENRAINMQEKWIKWNPANVSEGAFIVTDFIQDCVGTKVVLNDDKIVVEIFFDGILPIARSSVEGIRMRTWGEVQKKYSDKFFFKNWFLFKVENSKLSKWAEEESCGFYEAKHLTHYCIVTSEEIIDILSTFEPTVTVK